MALVTSEDSIESQNLPTCLHANEISQCIDNLTTVNMNQLISIVKHIHINTDALILIF